MQKHLKCVVRGIFDQTDEEWSYSLKFQSVFAGTDDSLAVDVNTGAVDAAILAFHNSADFAGGVKVTGHRWYDIGQDGRMYNNPVITEYAAANYVSGTGTLKFPIDTSLCVTLVADQRGPARFGRFYLPNPAISLGTDYRWSAAALGGTLTRVVTFVKAMSDAVGVTGLNSSRLINVSDNVTNSWQSVERVQLGRVPDRISRRRRKLLEDRQSSGDIDW